MNPNLTDELQCFRRAAELGCPDFKLVTFQDKAWNHPVSREYVAITLVYDEEIVEKLPSENPRQNRWAAAICAEWWFTRDLDDDGLANEDFMIMAKQARNFGRKYGEAK